MDKLNEIKINELSWKPDKKQELILKDISLNLANGEFYGIVGPNGAGKTTIARQLLKLLEKTTGDIYFDENNIDDMSRNKLAHKISFLPQSIKADTDFSVYDIVSMGREPHRKSFTSLTGTDKSIIDEALEFTDCMKNKDKIFSTLSGGERQRVMIARTIAQDTPWVVLDEPVSNLDVKHQISLMKVLNELRTKKSKTIIAILHDINLVANYCSKVILLKDGDVFAFGDTFSILTTENLKAVYGIDFEVINRDNKLPLIVPIY